VHEHEACYIPLAHQFAGAPDQLPREATLERLRPWLKSARHKKVGQHLKYDQHVFANHGVRLAGIAHGPVSWGNGRHERHLVFQNPEASRTAQTA
jgi:DNA polymerase-1